MKWKELKDAVEALGITDDSHICLVEVARTGEMRRGELSMRKSDDGLIVIEG